MTLACTSAAKLNWDLRVLGRRADGFHELRSWFVALDWRDRLSVEPAAAPAASALLVTGPAASGVPVDAGNLVLRAEAAWRSAFPAAARPLPPLRWTLEKRIPAGSGLGGGSGNAAAALRLLERLGGVRHPAPALLALAASLGSDVDFLWSHAGGAELRGGRGERLIARAPAPARAVVVAVPPFGISTAAVYAALVAPPLDASPEGAGADAALRPCAAPGPNQLEAAARRIEPLLGDFAAELERHGGFTLSGSGSAHFAPCADLEAAGRLAARLRALEGLTQIVVAAAILEGPALAVAPE